jgi:hypothetical protein
MPKPSPGQVLRTVSRLRPKQLLHQFKRLDPGLIPLDNGARLAPVARAKRHRLPSPTTVSGRTVSFCGGTYEVPVAGPWRPDMPSPFPFALHYLDFLRSGISRESSLQWIEEWRSAHSKWNAVEWHPFPASCRAVNLVWTALESPECAWLPGLIAAHADSIYRNQEWRLYANHLFINGKALSIVGRLIEHPDAPKWRAAGDAILRQGLREQWLPDGGHFERSVMYHRLMTADLLDLVEAFEASSSWPEWRELLLEKAEASLRFAHAARLGEDRFPLFNDASLDVGPSWGELRDYAEALGVPCPAGGPQAATFPDYGLAILRSERWASAFDCGALGPRYQPGHGHADTLTIEAMVDGLPFIVDPGTWSYDIGERRARDRSSAAHNAPVVGGRSSSEVWSSFRVGREARSRWTELTDTAAAGSHDGFQPLQVSRRVELSGCALRVQDECAAEFSTVFLIASGWSVSEQGGQWAKLNHLSGAKARMETTAHLLNTSTSAPYSERFLEPLEGAVLQLIGSGKMTTAFFILGS